MLANKKIPFFYAITLAALAITTYVLFTLVRASMAYYDAVDSGKAWSSGLFQSDPKTGYSLSKNFDGYKVFYDQRIPVKTDSYGTRISSQPRKNGKGIVLFLGDSFTFGDSVRAENAFPELVARRLDMTAYNAGTPSFGAAQMIIQAERLIPALKPDIVVAQYSPWIPYRSQSPLMETRLGQVPQPYISDHDGINIVYPALPGRMNEAPFARHIASDPSFLDRIGFVIRHGLPLVIGLDRDNVRLFVKQLSGEIPAPAANPAAITRFTYKRIDRLARENGAETVILIVGAAEPFEVPFGALPENAEIADAQTALILGLDEISGDAYARKYWHWSDAEEPKLLDYHPNKTAHRIIAETLSRTIAP